MPSFSCTDSHLEDSQPPSDGVVWWAPCLFFVSQTDTSLERTRQASRPKVRAKAPLPWVCNATGVAATRGLDAPDLSDGDHEHSDVSPAMGP